MEIFYTTQVPCPKCDKFTEECEVCSGKGILTLSSINLGEIPSVVQDIVKVNYDIEKELKNLQV